MHGAGIAPALPETCPIGSAGECELFRSVFTLNTLLMRVTDKLTGSIGLTGSRWLLLSAVVWREEAPTMTELSRRCLLSVQNVSRMVGSLEREGLVQRVQNPGEGRAQRVLLTDRGIEVLEQTVAAAQRLREGFLAGLDENDVAGLGSSIDRLVANLMRMEQELST
jgi:MarR family transcriptional regulator for hemolysin